MKKMFFAAALMMASAFLVADDEGVSAPIGTRQPTMQEDIKIQQTRAEAELEASKEEFQVKSPAINSTHDGVYLAPYYVYPMGDMITLNNGTLWGVSAGDRKKSFDWQFSDVVVVTQNTDWFSKYEYRLKNQTTGTSLRVHLWELSREAPQAVRYILQIDAERTQLMLSDGSVWDIPRGEKEPFGNWKSGDRIVIGCNDAWFSSSNPNILINLETFKYITSKCVYFRQEAGN